VIGRGCLFCFFAAANPSPGAAGKLAGGVGGAAGDARDLIERHAEHVMQHERHPLDGDQPGKIARAVREGASLPGPGAVLGRRTWEEFLGEIGS
jgi:hypothetical protein